MPEKTNSKYTPRVAEMLAALLGAKFTELHDAGAPEPLTLLGVRLRGIALVLDRCESPIEQLVALAFMTRWDVDILAEQHQGPVASQWYPRALGGRGALVNLIQQFPVGSAEDRREGRVFEVAPISARLDFVIEVTGVDSWNRIVVECDGHEFHEKTKEQAERDKSRDRALTTSGWRVLRFTGREIWRDPFVVVNDIEKALAADFGGTG